MSASTEKTPAKGNPAGIPATPLDLYSLPLNARVRVGQVARACTVSIPTVWRWSREGTFPRGQKLGPRTTVWSVADVLAHLDRANKGGA